MERISIKEWFALDEGRRLFDVRSPGEYAQGHIPAALNLPLFSDEERAQVGTLYKQVSSEKAYLRGLDIAGSKLSWYVSEGLRLAPGKKAGIHCWRGGKRSASMADLLSNADFDVVVLEGGYKSYRQFVLEKFGERKLKFVVLGGKTGSGKTQVLHELKNLGEQIIDLEALAHHKGSAFGALGQVPQPRSEQFENELFETFFHTDPNQRVWVENESRNIGRVFIPPGFWEQIKSAPLIILDVPLEKRIQRAMMEYACFPKDDLIAGFLKIKDRLGGQNVKTAVEAISNSDFFTAASIAIQYYDKTYVNSTAKGKFSKIFDLPVIQQNCTEIAHQLIEFANDNNL